MRKLLFFSFFIIGCSSNDNKLSTAIQKEQINVNSSSLIPVDEIEEIIEAERVKTSSVELIQDDTVEAINDGRNYTLYPDGKIKVIFDDHIDTFHLSTKDDLVNVYFHNYKNELIIYYEDTDYDFGGSYIECYDKKNYQLKWKTEAGGFNLCNPVIINNVSYVASIGFIGKLDLESGSYIWKHDDLYDRTKISSFGRIEKTKEHIHFVESKFPHDRKEPDQIVVNDETGKIEKIFYNK